ncbi:alanine racemase [Ekhidna lutea]|uniref:Alanine racemase n=1 Tax=Ekhidna lutea TaxID=447679 RepID=A0A239GPG0_EKHLU|nr:alanine racemase [Ekhidna lutea]SNS69974.1 alanine racemase [Ekhidna lutea]
MNSTSYIELSREAYQNNLDFLRSYIKKGTRISSVVKGNAYGHGIDDFVPMAESMGIDHFSVNSADEALEVLKARTNPKTEIMIMGFIANEDLSWAIENEISFFVFEFDRVRTAIEIARSTGKKARIHIELETGMNRTGFDQEEITRLIPLIKENRDKLEIEGLCTHYAGAESIANYLRVEEQKRDFKQMAELLAEHDIIPKMKHTCCSAASIRLPDMHEDMVRIGILQYGFWPSREIFIEYLKGKKDKTEPLRRLISWKSSVMSVKKVEMGEFVGYGTTYLAQRDMKIAIVPIGYSHGFSRSLSNTGRVLINGFRVPVVGMVNMNNMAIDVSELEQVKKGDEVTLIGKSGDVEISVASFGELSDQLNYELLTRLPTKIPRIIN